MKIQVSQAHQLALTALSASGYTDTEATAIANHLLDCELRGLSFGGLARALSVIERRQTMGSPAGPIRVVTQTASSASIDGADHVGYLVATQATDIAVEKATATGIAVVGARNTWYTGMFSYYLERITAAGLVGMIAGSGLHIVAPHGATSGKFGTNPIAFGFPAPDHPVIWDIGTAAVMLGEVKLSERLGRELSPGLAFAADGSPTTDPTAALNGAFAVWGGHKGSGLALSVQMLGMLAGASAEPDGLEDCGLLILAIDPTVLGNGAQFPERIGEYARSVRSTRPANPTRPVRMPFDRSAAERTRRVTSGLVDVDQQIIEALRSIIDGETAPRIGEI